MWTEVATMFQRPAARCLLLSSTTSLSGEISPSVVSESEGAMSKMHPEMIKIQSERSITAHGWETPLQRWQIAELTEYDIMNMSISELRNVISSSLSSESLRSISDRDWFDIASLRGLARRARYTCRRQGY